MAADAPVVREMAQALAVARRAEAVRARLCFERARAPGLAPDPAAQHPLRVAAATAARIAATVAA